MITGEFGASDGDLGGGTSWVNNLGTLLSNGSLPQVEAIIYFNDGDQAFSSNPQTHAAVKALLRRTPGPRR